MYHARASHGPKFLVQFWSTGGPQRNRFKTQFLNFLFERKKISSINQYEFNGGVAQLVRARDS